MGMGGGHNNNNRGRAYGVMLLLAFGAALFGVMVVQKFRERRIFHLLLLHKDRHLHSLHFLLQKEREYTKELKSKNEAMKAKIYAVRNQKMELDRRLLEMQSTIDSMKDKEKAMESALEEKQNEIKMLRDSCLDPENERAQMLALMESLKQKEAEIEDLKHRLENPFTASSNDPSTPPTNFSTITNTSRDYKIEINEQLRNSTSYSEGVSLAIGEERDNISTQLEKGENNGEAEKESERRISSNEKMEVSGEDHEIPISENSVKNFKNEANSNSTKGNFSYGEESVNESLQHEGAFHAGEENNTSNTTVNGEGEVSKAGEPYSVAENVDGEEDEANTTGMLRNEHSQLSFGGGLKLEVMKKTRSKGSSSRGELKYVNVGRANGKRRRVVARNRLLDNNKNNRYTSMRGRKSSGADQGGRIDREVGTMTTSKNKGQTEMEGTRTTHKNSAVVNSRGTLERPRISQNIEGLDVDADNIRNVPEKQSSDGAQRYEKQEVDGNSERRNSEAAEIASNEEEQEETEIANGDFYGESDSGFEEDEEKQRELMHLSY